jgi:anti-anti-sigma factor
MFFPGRSQPLCHYGEHFALRVSRDPERYVLEVYGELDVHTAGLLESRIEDAESSSTPRLLVDLSGVDFMASAGLNVLVDANVRASGNGHALALLRPPDDVMHRILEEVGTAAHLPFED